jgi:hypothetical protein
VAVGSPQTYDLGALAITDALALPDGRLVASTAAEDTANAVDDGPVSDAALALLDGAEVVGITGLPDGPDGPEKVEGLALDRIEGTTAHLVAIIDADNPTAASRAVRVALELPP